MTVKCCTTFPPVQKSCRTPNPFTRKWRGWDKPLDDVRKFSDLPAQAQKYVRRLEEIVETEIILVSVGPSREQTILLKNPFDA